MSTSTIATIASTVVGLLITIFTFLTGCKSLSECLNAAKLDDKATTDESREQIRPDPVRILNARLDGLCAEKALYALYERSPCRVSAFNAEVYNDHERIGALRQLAKAHSQALGSLIEQFSRSAADHPELRYAEVAKIYKNWNEERIQRIDYILRLDPVWSEYNLERLRLHTKLHADLEVFSDSVGSGQKVSRTKP